MKFEIIPGTEPSWQLPARQGALPLSWARGRGSSGLGPQPAAFAERILSFPVLQEEANMKFGLSKNP